MNNVELIGRLTDEPTVGSGERNGNSYRRASFTVAVNRTGNAADFIRCVAFDKTADLIEQYFHKGNQIGISGSIRTGSYTNKEGRKVNTVDVLVSHVDFIDPKNTTARDGGFDESQAFEPFDGGIPF